VLKIQFKVNNDIHKAHLRYNHYLDSHKILTDCLIKMRYNHYLDSHKILLDCLIKMIVKIFLSLFYSIRLLFLNYLILIFLLNQGYVVIWIKGVSNLRLICHHLLNILLVRLKLLINDHLLKCIWRIKILFSRKRIFLQHNINFMKQRIFIKILNNHWILIFRKFKINLKILLICLKYDCLKSLDQI